MNDFQVKHVHCAQACYKEIPAESLYCNKYDDVWEMDLADLSFLYKYNV